MSDILVVSHTPRLPSEYQEVEYIESSGSQWIDTGVILTLENTNIRCDADVIVSTTALDKTIFGTNGGGNTYYHLTPYDYQWYYGTNGSEGHSGSYSNIIGTEYIISFNNNGKIIINGEIIVENKIFTAKNKSITINTRMNGTSIWKFKYFKIYDDSSIIRNFIPCYRKSDSKPGMYDLVTNTFYVNQGTGADFTVGNTVYYTLIETTNTMIEEAQNVNNS